MRNRGSREKRERERERERRRRAPKKKDALFVCTTEVHVVHPIPSSTACCSPPLCPFPAKQALWRCLYHHHITVCIQNGTFAGAALSQRLPMYCTHAVQHVVLGRSGLFRASFPRPALSTAPQRRSVPVSLQRTAALSTRQHTKAGMRPCSTLFPVPFPSVCPFPPPPPLQ